MAKNRHKKAEQAPQGSMPSQEKLDQIAGTAPQIVEPDANNLGETTEGIVLSKQEGENTSQAIRRLSAEGKTPGQIAKTLGIRYQHAYNVLKRPLKGRGTPAAN